MVKPNCINIRNKHLLIKRWKLAEQSLKRIGGEFKPKNSGLISISGAKMKKHDVTVFSPYPFKVGQKIYIDEVAEKTTGKSSVWMIAKSN